MTLAVALICRDEETILPRMLASVEELADTVYAVDTGSKDATRAVLKDAGAKVMQIDWRGFADARSRALALAADHDWVLMVDADQTVEAHPDFREWLDAADHAADVYTVSVAEAGTTWRMPRLTRSGTTWVYQGATHEWLDTTGRRSRPVEGIALVHHADGSSRPGKHERDIELLAAGVRAGEARAVYYTAQALWCLGRTGEAVAMYRRRADMGGWEEERWHAEYMAARLSDDVPGLLAAHAQRPHRHEPLTWAARIVARRGHTDMLFCEDGDRG